MVAFDPLHKGLHHPTDCCRDVEPQQQVSKNSLLITEDSRFSVGPCLLVGGRQEFLIDGGKDVPLTPSVEGGSLPVHLLKSSSALVEPVNKKQEGATAVLI